MQTDLVIWNLHLALGNFLIMSLSFPPMKNQATIPITTDTSNILVTLTSPSTITTTTISSASGMVSINPAPAMSVAAKMTKFGNVVPKKAQNTKKRLELVMSFLTLPGVFTILMAHHQVKPIIHWFLLYKVF